MTFTLDGLPVFTLGGYSRGVKGPVAVAESGRGGLVIACSESLVQLDSGDVMAPSQVYTGGGDVAVACSESLAQLGSGDVMAPSDSKVCTGGGDVVVGGIAAVTATAGAATVAAASESGGVRDGVSVSCALHCVVAMAPLAGGGLVVRETTRLVVFKCLLLRFGWLEAVHHAASLA